MMLFLLFPFCSEGMTWAPVRLHFMLNDRCFDVSRVFRICIARLYGQLIVLLLLHSIKHLNKKKTFYTYE